MNDRDVKFLRLSDFPRLIVKMKTNRKLSNMSIYMRSLSAVSNNAVYSRFDVVFGSPNSAPLFFGGMPGMQECVKCRFAAFAPAARI
jgi:hypothetical protein